MRNLANILLIGSLMMYCSSITKAQCKEFANEICSNGISSYNYRENVSSTVIVEGETVEIFKTFYPKQDYRIYICSEDKNQKIEFTVMDTNRNVLFDNKNTSLSNTWDFNSDTSQLLIISIKISANDSIADYLRSSCVAVLIGYN